MSSPAKKPSVCITVSLESILDADYVANKLRNAQRIRIDRESEASHDLIRLLDKPGVSAYSVYKKISFFEQGVGSALSRGALFSRRGSTLTCSRKGDGVEFRRFFFNLFVVMKSHATSSQNRYSGNPASCHYPGN